MHLSTEAMSARKLVQRSRDESARFVRLSVLPITQVSVRRTLELYREHPYESYVVRDRSCEHHFAAKSQPMKLRYGQVNIMNTLKASRLTNSIELCFPLGV